MPGSEHWEWAADTGPRGNLREAVALFNTEDDLQSAVDDLECHGFSNAAISRPKPIDEIEQELDHKVISVHELEDDVAVPREAYIDRGSRASGVMVLIVVPVYIALLVAASVATSYGFELWQAVLLTVVFGLVGMLWGGYYALKVSRSTKQRIRREQALGGLLLWVRTGSKTQETKALDILRRHAGRDVHLHGPAIH